MAHLFKDSRDLAEKLSKPKISENSKIYNIDIKDYFMSGAHSELPNLSDMYVTEDRRVAFKKAVDFILSNQFVELDVSDLFLYKVVAGSGMGLECSGDSSDVCFDRMVEKAYCNNKTVRERYHVEFYGRFTDDMLVVLGGSKDSRREFIDGMKKRSRFFKLKVESVNAASAIMLDLVVQKGARFKASGCLDISIHTKITAQGAALSSSSRHVPSIHTSWPLSRLVHFQSVCSCRSSFRDAALRLLQKLTLSDSNHPVLETLSACIVHGTPASGSSFARLPLTRCSRLILPYHLALSGLPKRLIALDRFFEEAGFSELRVRISWGLSGKSIHRICLRDCVTKFKLTRVA